MIFLKADVATNESKLHPLKAKEDISSIFWILGISTNLTFTGALINRLQFLEKMKLFTEQKEGLEGSTVMIFSCGDWLNALPLNWTQFLGICIDSKWDLIKTFPEICISVSGNINDFILHVEKAYVWISSILVLDRSTDVKLQ